MGHQRKYCPSGSRGVTLLREPLAVGTGPKAGSPAFLQTIEFKSYYYGSKLVPKQIHLTTQSGTDTTHHTARFLKLTY